MAQAFSELNCFLHKHWHINVDWQLGTVILNNLTGNNISDSQRLPYGETLHPRHEEGSQKIIPCARGIDCFNLSGWD
jgi:hypothetical protein